MPQTMKEDVEGNDCKLDFLLLAIGYNDFGLIELQGWTLCQVV